MWLEADADASASSLADVLPLAITDRFGQPDPVAAGVAVLRRTGRQPMAHLARRDAAKAEQVAATALDTLLLMEGVPDTVTLVREFSVRLPHARIGVVGNPFVAGEIDRLHAKAEAGAAFYVAQAGWDDQAYQDLLARGPKITALASVLCVGPRLARALLNGEVPGVTLPESLAHRIGSEGGGEAPIRRLAARIRALATMGFAGVHIAGISRPATARRLLEILGTRVGAGLTRADPAERGKEGE